MKFPTMTALCLWLATTAQGAVVSGNLIDDSGSLLPISVTFSMLNKQATAVGNSTALGISITTYADTNANFSQTLIGGLYSCSFGLGLPTVKIIVPPDTNSYTFNFCASLATNVPAFVWTNNFIIRIVGAGGTTVSTNGNTLVISSTGGSGGGTPALAGTNVFIQLQGGSNQINVPFGIFDLFGTGAALQARAVTNTQSGVALSGTFTGPLIGNAATATTASAVSGPVTATSGNVATNFGLAGTLGQQSDYSGSPWGQNESQRHPLFFYFAPYPRHQAGSPDAAEFQITNYFNSLASSGQLAIITNEGYYPVFFLDVGWEGRRNFNPSFIVTNDGTLDWDHSMFPDGMPWLVQKLRTNGIGTMPSLYGVATPAYTIAAPESGWTISVTGTSPLPYTNGIGPGGLVYTNSNYKVCELSGPDMLRWDVNELRWWGCWGFGMNDVNQQPDNIVATERIVADARNRFFAAPGFNQNPGCSYWNQNLAAINWPQATNGWTATNTTSIYANWIENPPDFISTPPVQFWPYETTTQPGVYGDITRQFHNGVSFENLASPVNGRAFTNITFCWPSTHRTSEGAWWPSAADTSGIALAAAAFDSACWDIDAYTNTTMTALIVYFQNTTYRSFLTNAFMDGLSAMPQMVYDQGVGQGTVWKKPLSNGDTLIWLSNEATNGWYPSITWDQLGFNTNDWYAVTGSQIFGPVSSWLPCTNKIGMFTNVFLNAGAQFFIRLSKQPDASQLLGTVPAPQLPYPAQGAAAALTNLAAGNGSALTSLNAANVSGVWSAPLLTNGTSVPVVFSNRISVAGGSYPDNIFTAVSFSGVVDIGDAGFDVNKTFEIVNDAAKTVVVSATNGITFYGPFSASLNGANLQPGSAGTNSLNMAQFFYALTNGVMMPLPGGTVVGNQFLGTNAAGQWVLGTGGGSILATLVTNNASTPIVVTGSGVNSTISTNQITVTGAGVSTAIASNTVTTGSIIATNLANFYYVQTNFISGATYVNTNAFQERVSVGTRVMAGTSVGNVAGFMLWYDPAGGSAWKTNDDGTTISAIGTLAMTTPYKLNGVMPAGATFVFTNVSSGGTSTLISGTGQISIP